MKSKPKILEITYDIDWFIDEAKKEADKQKRDALLELKEEKIKEKKNCD